MFFFQSIFFHTGISTRIRRTASREANASRHHVGAPKTPFEHHGIIMVPRGLRGLSLTLYAESHSPLRLPLKKSSSRSPRFTEKNSETEKKKKTETTRFGGALGS